jgi:hypothetical protein
MATTSRLNPFAPPAPQNWKASSIPSNGTLAGPGRRAGLGSQLRSSWRRTNRRQAHSAAHRRRSMRRVCGLATLSTWRAIEGQWIDRRLVAACPQACAAPGGFAALRGSAWLSPARPRAGSTGPSAWPAPPETKTARQTPRPAAPLSCLSRAQSTRPRRPPASGRSARSSSRCSRSRSFATRAATAEAHAAETHVHPGSTGSPHRGHTPPPRSRPFRVTSHAPLSQWAPTPAANRPTTAPARRSGPRATHSRNHPRGTCAAPQCAPA